MTASAIPPERASFTSPIIDYAPPPSASVSRRACRPRPLRCTVTLRVGCDRSPHLRWFGSPSRRTRRWCSPTRRCAGYSRSSTGAGPSHSYAHWWRPYWSTPWSGWPGRRTRPRRHCAGCGCGWSMTKPPRCSAVTPAASASAPSPRASNVTVTDGGLSPYRSAETASVCGAQERSEPQRCRTVSQPATALGGLGLPARGFPPLPPTAAGRRRHGLRAPPECCTCADPSSDGPV